MANPPIAKEATMLVYPSIAETIGIIHMNVFPTDTTAHDAGRAAPARRRVVAVTRVMNSQLMQPLDQARQALKRVLEGQEAKARPIPAIAFESAR